MTTLHRLMILKRLRTEINGARSLRRYAALIRVSPGYLCDVMRGRCDPGPKILKALGMEKAPSPQRYRKAT